MFKDSSAKYYQKKTHAKLKKACEWYQSLSKEGKEKSENMVAKDTKIYQKMKNKSWLRIEKNIKEEEKTSIIIRNYFYLENFVSFLRLGYNQWQNIWE